MLQPRLGTVAEHDAELLEQLFEEINSANFGGAIKARPLWKVPSATEPAPAALSIKNLSTSDLDKLSKAIVLRNANKCDEALALLEELQQKGCKEVKNFYCRLLKKAGRPEWISYAESINRLSGDALLTPPAGIEPCDGVINILIHPALSHSAGYKAPKSVIRYAQHHELLHIFLGTTADDPHPTVFRRLDNAIPGRHEAVQWLRRHGFATI